MPNSNDVIKSTNAKETTMRRTTATEATNVGLIVLLLTGTVVCTARAAKKSGAPLPTLKASVTGAYALEPIRKALCVGEKPKGHE